MVAETPEKRGPGSTFRNAPTPGRGKAGAIAKRPGARNQPSPCPAILPSKDCGSSRVVVRPRLIVVARKPALDQVAVVAAVVIVGGGRFILVMRAVSPARQGAAATMHDEAQDDDDREERN